MVKLIITNFITFSLVLSWFTFFAPQQHSKGVDNLNTKEEFIADYKREQTQRVITPVKLYFEKGKKVQLPTELYQAELLKNIVLMMMTGVIFI